MATVIGYSRIQSIPEPPPTSEAQGYLISFPQSPAGSALASAATLGAGKTWELDGQAPVSGKLRVPQHCILVVLWQPIHLPGPAAELL